MFYRLTLRQSLHLTSEPRLSKFDLIKCKKIVRTLENENWTELVKDASRVTNLFWSEVDPMGVTRCSCLIFTAMRPPYARAPEIYSEEHDSSIFRQSSNLVCGFSIGPFLKRRTKSLRNGLHDGTD